MTAIAAPITGDARRRAVTRLRELQVRFGQRGVLTTAGRAPPARRVAGITNER